MPPKRQSRTARSRRPPARQRIASRPSPSLGSVAEADELQAEPTAGIQRQTNRSGVVTGGMRRPRIARAPAQIVIGNYDFLRHDLRLLFVLAPSLVVVMVILSFIVH